MGKMLLGGFAVSVGLAGVIGFGSPTPNAALSAAAVVKQQKLAQQRSTYVFQLDDAAEQTQEDLSVQQQLQSASK